MAASGGLPAQPMDDPIIITAYMHKGGTGKTTYSALIGAALAKLGNTVIMVDADPQMSLTTFWAEDRLEGEPPSEAEEEDEEGASSDGEGGEAGSGGEGGEDGFSLMLPPIPCDRLRKPDALPADVFHGIKLWCEDKDNLFDTLNNTVLDDRFVATPTSVNTDDYRGRLLLLPGHPSLPRFAYDLERNDETTLAPRYYGAFRKAMLDMGRQHGAKFVLVDIGPHIDTLHKVMICSSNVIQPVVGACSYSIFSTHNLLYEVMPGWIRWHSSFAPEHQTPAAYAFNQQFPYIAPFLCFNYDMKGSHVLWSASNFLETLRQTIMGEAKGGDTKPLPPEVRKLYIPFQRRGKPPQMLAAFIKRLSFLPVAQETGRAFFDLSERNLKDYYQNSMQELDVDKLNKEKDYVWSRFKALSQNLLLLREALCEQRRAASQQEQQQRQQRKERKERGREDGDRRGKKEKKKQRRLEGQTAAAVGAGPSSPAAAAAAAQPVHGAARRKPAAPMHISPPE